MKGCVPILKVSLILFNTIFVAAGVAVAVIGGYIAFTDFKTYTDFLSTNEEVKAISASGYILIGIGFIIITVYFLGCCGVFSGNPCMIYSFSGILGLIFLAEIAIVITLFVFSSHAKETVRVTLKDNLEKYFTSNEKIYKFGWDKVQKSFSCCGVNNYTDWTNTTFFNENGKIVPNSCCKTVCNKGGVDTLNDTESINQDGCFSVFENYLEKNIDWIGAIASGIAGIQLGVTIMACYFGSKMNTSRNWYSVLRLNRYSHRYRDASPFLYSHQTFV